MGRGKFDDLRPASEQEVQEFWGAYRDPILRLLEEANDVAFGGNGKITESRQLIATLPNHPKFGKPNFVWTTSRREQLAIRPDIFARAFNVYATRPRGSEEAQQHHWVVNGEQALVVCVQRWVEELLRLR